MNVIINVYLHKFIMLIDWDVTKGDLGLVGVLAALFVIDGITSCFALEMNCFSVNIAGICPFGN